MAPRRPHRRADGPSLHPSDLCGHGHLLPQPQGDRDLSPTGPSELVLRGPPDLGEAQGRARRDARWAARGAAASRGGRTRGVAGASAVQAAGRAGARRARAEGGTGRRADLLQAADHARARPAHCGERGGGPHACRGARVLPCDRGRARRAVGDVGDLRRGHVQPAGSGEDRDRGATRSWMRDPDRRRRRGAGACAFRDARLPKPAGQDRRGDRLGRVASHRRHRRAR